MILRGAQLVTFCLSTIVMIPAVQAGPIQDADVKADAYVNWDHVLPNVKSKIDPVYLAGALDGAFVSRNLADLPKSKMFLKGHGAPPSVVELYAPKALKLLQSRYVGYPLFVLTVAANMYDVYNFFFLDKTMVPLKLSDRGLEPVSEHKDNQ